MKSTIFLNPFVVMILLVLPSCKIDSIGSVELRSEQPTGDVALYLEEAMSPCIPFRGSDHNPCLPGTPSEVETFSSFGLVRRWPSPFPTWVDILLGDDNVTLATHLVIRGEALFGTTRCETYHLKLGSYWHKLFDIELVNLVENSGLYYYCFTDIGVKEYIVGSGPTILTVAMHVESILYGGTDFNELSDSQKNKWVRSVLNDPQSRVATVYEGKELVLLLGLPHTIAVESWKVSAPVAGVWFVQKFGDQIRAVAQDVNRARTDAERSQMDMPLDDLTKQIKKAAEERISLTDGRIGVESYLPLLVNDANYLKDYYTSVGAVYDASEGSTVLPPLAPGEGDPAAPTIPVNEGTTDTTLPVPGEETSVPPSSDDAGLTVGQETTTTTSTTTVAEVPVTTEITPTVTTAAPVEEPVATVPDATETVTGTTTTTTTTAVVETESNGEDVSPSADDDSSGGEPAASTITTSTLAQTTAVVAPSGGDDGSVEGPDTTVPSDGVAPPVDNGGPEEAEQPDTGPPVDDG